MNLKKIIRQIKVWHNFSLFCEHHRPHDLRPPNLAFPRFETSLLAVPNVVYILGNILSEPNWIHFYYCGYYLTSYHTIWQYGLWSFQTGGTKLDRFLPKNQHTQRKLLNFKNLCWMFKFTGKKWSSTNRFSLIHLIHSSVDFMHLVKAICINYDIVSKTKFRQSNSLIHVRQT